MTDQPNTSGADALHATWGLSYANYLVWPRSVMQSMPDEWQGKMAVLIEEINEAAMKHGIQ